MTEFEWDEDKDALNWRKHKIRFEDARFVFDDPLQISKPFVENGEERWRTIGMINACLLLLVIHTVRENGTEVIRIISARKLTLEEREDYELG